MTEDEDWPPARPALNPSLATHALEGSPDQVRPHVATGIVEALLEAVQERHEDEAAGVKAKDFVRGYETGLAMAALLLNVQEAAFPQRETQLPAWLAAHPEGSN